MLSLCLILNSDLYCVHGIVCFEVVVLARSFFYRMEIFTFFLGT